MFSNQSKTLVTGTLDVLETVGKKTFETIAEGDHGIKHILHNKGNKANLSQVCEHSITAGYFNLRVFRE